VKTVARDENYLFRSLNIKLKDKVNTLIKIKAIQYFHVLSEGQTIQPLTTIVGQAETEICICALFV
jgi:hypothetical protein